MFCLTPLNSMLSRHFLQKNQVIMANLTQSRSTGPHQFPLLVPSCCMRIYIILLLQHHYLLSRSITQMYLITQRIRRVQVELSSDMQVSAPYHPAGQITRRKSSKKSDAKCLIKKNVHQKNISVSHSKDEDIELHSCF